MNEISINVKLKGEIAQLVNDIINKGYSESKSDLVRNSIVFYAMKLGLFSPKALHNVALDKIKASGIKYTDEEISKQLKEKDLENLVTVKHAGLKYLIALDDHYRDFEEYITPKEFIEYLGLAPSDTEY